MFSTITNIFYKIDENFCWITTRDPWLWM